MGTFRFDWRWVALIAFVILLLNVGRLPQPVVVAALGGGGGYLLLLGWRAWTGGGSSRGRVTYWRGQRYEIPPSRRGPALPGRGAIGPALLYFLIGGVMVLAAISMLLQVLRPVAI